MRADVSAKYQKVEDLKLEGKSTRSLNVENRTEGMKEYCLKRFEANVDLVPLHCRDALRLYLTDGLEPGGFLFSVLSNDFKGAAIRADGTNSVRLRDYAHFLASGLPISAQGSQERVESWIRHEGFKGLIEAENQEQELLSQRPEPNGSEESFFTNL